MDYKTTILRTTLEVGEKLLPEFTGLHFGILGENSAVFDYTAYFEENELEPINYKTFMRLNKHFIEYIIQDSGKGTSQLFFQNTDGHILVAAELSFLFLAFVQPELCRYFNGLVTDAVTEGVAVSNGFVYSQAAQRLPSDTLSEIIRNRENGTDSEG